MITTERLKATRRQIALKIDDLMDCFECVPMDTQRSEWVLITRLNKIGARLDERILNRRLGEVLQALTHGYRSFD